MKRLFFAALVALGGVSSAWGGPPGPPPGRPGFRPPRPPPARWHHRPPRPPTWGWGLGISPWGSVFSVGTRVGRHGAFGLSLPLVPPPVVREERTIVVTPPAQQTIVVQPGQTSESGAQAAQPSPPKRTPGILPAYAPGAAKQAKVWVEGYWRVTRDPEGNETERTWVPGHWEEEGAAAP